MHRFVLVLALAAVALAGRASRMSRRCAPVRGADGLHLCPHKLRFDAAQRYCQAHFDNGHLALIHNAAVNKAVLAAVSALPGSLRAGEQTAWIGLHDRDTEGVFESMSPTHRAPKFKDWAPSEPNNRRGKEHCVEINHKDGWNDRRCHKKQAFVCQEGADKQKHFVKMDGYVMCGAQHIDGRQFGRFGVQAVATDGDQRYDFGVWTTKPSRLSAARSLFEMDAEVEAYAALHPLTTTLTVSQDGRHWKSLCPSRIDLVDNAVYAVRETSAQEHVFDSARSDLWLRDETRVSVDVCAKCRELAPHGHPGLRVAEHYKSPHKHPLPVFGAAPPRGEEGVIPK